MRVFIENLDAGGKPRVEDERIRAEWFNATSNLADTLRSQLVLVENNELYYT